MKKQNQAVLNQELNAQIQYKLIEELSASEKRYRELIESLRTVVFKCESNGEISFLNQAWTELLGYSVKEALGKPLINYIHPEDKQQGSAMLVKQLNDKYCEETEELRFRHQNGAYTWLLIAVRISDSEGKIGSLYDIDHRKRAEETLLEANDQLEERVQKRTAELASLNKNLGKEVEERRHAQEDLRNAFIKLKQTQENLLKAERLAAVGETSGRVAHEVLNPITSIYSRIESNIQDWKGLKGYIETMQEIMHDWEEEFDKKTLLDYLNELSDGDDSYGKEDFRLLRKLTLSCVDFQSQREDDLNFMHKQLQRVIKIINGLRESTITRRSIKIFTILSPINEALEGLEDSLEKRNIKVSRDFLDEMPLIRADESEIVQLFTNMFRNAMQSIDEKMQKGGEIKINVHRDNDIINLFIKDTGCGIPKDSQDNIFNFNFTTKSREQGTGFGLGISRRFVRECGGDLFLFESELGIGTTFQLQFPIYEE